MKCWASAATSSSSSSATARISQIKKDVKNEDRSGDMYENKGSHDKMSGVFRKFHGHFVQSRRILPVCEGKKVQDARRVFDEFFPLPWGERGRGTRSGEGLFPGVRPLERSTVKPRGFAGA
jgi:hypothetical protein